VASRETASAVSIASEMKNLVFPKSIEEPGLGHGDSN
jgi:hypothetical protein